jgi:glycosyltransferase A (GT-A) superfamily protein (DUF2064 family)
MLRAAAHALTEQDAVFVPALDGGYALIGLRRPEASLFDGMPWSTARVMPESRERAQRAGLRWAELPAVPRGEVVDELWSVGRLGQAARHDGLWSRATLEVCLAMLAGQASPETLRHQVPTRD